MGTSASRAIAARTRNVIATIALLMFALGFMPSFALANEEGAQEVRASQAEENFGVAPMLASGLVGNPGAIINSDVTLDASDPLIGSFMVDGLTYSVNSDGLTLVAVDASAVAEDGSVSIPATVAYGGTTYDVTAIGPYAFYLSGAASVGLPASVASVDSRAFRTSAVGSVSAESGNPSFASFDGALYSADKSCLLLIPEGRAGSVSIPSETEVVEASVFSHCSLVEAIDVDGDGAAFASWDGLLYDASGETLLRVPAGVTEITIRDGCTTIAAGAMEGCAKLERINAPATVTSVSPDVFASIPTVSLPAAAMLGNSQQVQYSAGSEDPDAAPKLASGQAGNSDGAEGDALQLTAIVALSTTDDDLPQVDPAAITVVLPDGVLRTSWKQAGFTIEGGSNEEATAPIASVMLSEDVELSGFAPDGEALSEGLPLAALQSGSSYAAGTTSIHPNGGALWRYYVASEEWDIANKTDPFTESTWQNFYVSGNWLIQTNGARKWTGYYNGVYCTGWSRIANNGMGGAKLADDYRFTATDGTIYACWPSATVTFNKNNSDSGSTQGTSSISCTVAQPMPAITRPTRPGYVFAGYWTEATGGTQYYYDNGSSAQKWDKNKDTTLYAHWTKKASYEVMLDKKGGSGGAASPIYYWPEKGYTTSSTSTTVLSTVSKPSLSNWTFSGYTDDMGTNSFLYIGSSGAPTTRTLTSDKTLYANWTKTVTLNANGGTAGSLTSLTAGIGRPLGQKSTGFNSVDQPIQSLFDKGITDRSSWKPTRSGRAFLGYYDTSASSGGTCYINADGTVTRFCDPVTKDMPSTLYARWGYTVTFDKKGGSGGTDSVAVQYSTSVPTIIAPTLSDWTFRGYTNDMGTSTYLFVDSGGKGTTRTITGNKTVYANWTKTVSLNANGGTAGSLTSLTAGIGRPLGQKCSQVPSGNVDYPIRSLFDEGITDSSGWKPTRSGRAFLGYYDTSASSGGTCYINADGTVTRFCDPVTKDMPSTLYARWGCTVTFVKNSGEGGTDSVDVEYNSTVPTITTPTHSDWTFRGYTDTMQKNAALYVKPDGTGTTRTITGNKTVYANWTKTVSLNANGGTEGSLTSLIAGVGRAFGQKCDQVPSTDPDYPIRSLFDEGITDDENWAPKRAGYMFDGYYDTSASTGGECYVSANGAAQRVCSPVRFPMPDTLYARWSGNGITLTWDPHNGTDSWTTTQTYSDTAKVTLPMAPEWEGRTFAGWWTAETDGTPVTNATDLPTSDATYHAHWTEDAYTISYDYAGGSVSGNPTTYKVTSDAFTLKNPTRTGYAFVGWSGTELDGEENTSVKVEKGSTGNRSYTAHWKANEYAVEYYDSAGENLLYQVDGIPYDADRYYLAAASVADGYVTPGYAAAGWASNPRQANADFEFGVAAISVGINEVATNAEDDRVKRLYLAESPKTISLTWVSLGEEFATTCAAFSPDAKVPLPDGTPTRDPGWAFMGWWTEEEGGEQVTAGTPLPTDDAEYYARWTPVVSAVVPLEVTARVDLLGLEEQAEASGYIESRSGGALKVAEVAYTALPGATELFGADAPKVTLKASVPGEEGQWWASQPVLSFPLNSNGGVVGNGDRLAAFDMASYEARVPITYTFSIPDDVLASIDPARFEQVTTPIGQVVYIVALQDPSA